MEHDPADQSMQQLVMWVVWQEGTAPSTTLKPSSSLNVLGKSGTDV